VGGVAADSLMPLRLGWQAAKSETKGHKKKALSLKPSRENNLFEIDYLTTAFTVSATAFTVESTLAAAAVAAAAIESAVFCAASAAALAFSAPPQATIATAKPHTITDAMNFFIVYRLLKFAQR
jgi:hypothetical protein